MHKPKPQAKRQNLIDEIETWIEQSKTRGVKQEIGIPTGDSGTITVKATIFDNLLAVHRGLISGYTVTHVGTMQAMGIWFTTQKDAKRFLFSMLRLADWNFTDADSKKGRESIISVAAVGFILRDYCGLKEQRIDLERLRKVVDKIQEVLLRRGARHG